MPEPSGLIPVGQAARLLMISEERIRQLVKQSGSKPVDIISGATIGEVDHHREPLQEGAEYDTGDHQRQQQHVGRRSRPAKANATGRN